MKTHILCISDGTKSVTQKEVLCHIYIWENKFTVRKLTRTLSLHDSLSLFNSHLNGVCAKRYKDTFNQVLVSRSSELRIRGQSAHSCQKGLQQTVAVYRRDSWHHGQLADFTDGREALQRSIPLDVSKLFPLVLLPHKVD